MSMVNFSNTCPHCLAVFSLSLGNFKRKGKKSAGLSGSATSNHTCAVCVQGKWKIEDRTKLTGYKSVQKKTLLNLS